jgi:hypothetical protein
MTRAQDQKDEAAAEKVRLDNEYAAEQKRNADSMQNPAKQKSVPAEGDSAARLRAFEDEVFGKDAVRIDGVIERGVGSPYAKMTDERKAQYAALEAVIAAEQKLNDATAAVGAAEAERVAAEERLAMCGKVAQEKAAEAEKAKASAAR